MRLLYVCGLGCLAPFTIFVALCSPVFAVPPPDEIAAARVLGPEWKQLSRRAGIVFAGSVLSAGLPSANCGAPVSQFSAANLTAQVQNRDGACPVPAADQPIPAIELRFRVDRPIAGVAPGQVLTIREWTGALSRQRSLRRGDRILLFLYPRSRLGLTSPVGGPQGQIRLDPSGQYVTQQSFAAPSRASGAGDRNSSRAAGSSSRRVPISQLTRAIRAARGE